MHRLAPLALILVFNTTTARAEDADTDGGARSTVKIEDVRDDKNSVDGNIDDEITNAKLRAESGSRSKWSASATTDYKGGTLGDAFGESRPQLVAEPGKQDTTSIDAGVGGRYRWSKHDSVTATTNFGLNAPFSTRRRVTDAEQKQFNVYDPELSYNRVGRIGNVQSNGKLTLSPGTSLQSQEVDRIMTYSAQNVFLHNFDNQITTGLALEGAYNQYVSGAGMNMLNRQELTERYGDYRSFYGGDSRSEWSLGVFPYVEYAFSDRYQFRTVFGWFNYRHLFGDDKSLRVLRQSAFQSVGLGIAITRDIYLYPNVQFIPDDVRLTRTNVALNAQINVF